MDYKLHKRFWRHLLTAPFIYMMLFPLVFLDVLLEVYHRIGFWLCGMPYVKREAYIRIDRHKLSYLNAFDKLNCMYCGYANGLLRYGVEIAGRTERYWCGIQHNKAAPFLGHAHQVDFVPYGDEEAYKKKFTR